MALEPRIRAALVELGFHEQVAELEVTGHAALPNADGTETIIGQSDFEAMARQYLADPGEGGWRAAMIEGRLSARPDQVESTAESLTVVERPRRGGTAVKVVVALVLAYAAWRILA